MIFNENDEDITLYCNNVSQSFQKVSTYRKKYQKLKYIRIIDNILLWIISLIDILFFVGVFSFNIENIIFLIVWNVLGIGGLILLSNYSSPKLRKAEQEYWRVSNEYNKKYIKPLEEN